jgi:hypothetical protein
MVPIAGSTELSGKRWRDGKPVPTLASAFLAHPDLLSACLARARMVAGEAKEAEAVKAEI